MVSWLWGTVQKTLKRKKNADKRKTLKNKKRKDEEYRESQITTINIFGFTFYIKNYILLKIIVWKKVVYTITSYLQFLCVTEYLKRSNDAPKFNTHTYNSYNIIEIYINRLSTTTQIFIAMNYLILMSEK